MIKKTIYHLSVCRESNKEQIVPFDSSTPFQAFHVTETIGHDNEVFEIKSIHHVVHENAHDILHTVTLYVVDVQKK
ncbi:MAG: hypothetical protein WBW41_02515 [Verrucomicrobiia bacterium]